MADRLRLPDPLRTAGALLAGDWRLVLVPLTAFGALGGVAVVTAAAVHATLGRRTQVFGSAYRTAGFGIAAEPSSGNVVTTIVPTWATFAVLVAAYVAAAFVLTFAAAVVAAAVHRRLTDPAGGDPLEGAVADAGRRWRHLLAWSAFGAVVGVAHRLVEKRALLGAVTGRPATSSWHQAAWLAVPVVVAEGRSPVRSLTRAGELVDRTWGEGSLARTGVGTASALLLAPSAVTAVALAPTGTAGLVVTVALAAPAAAVAVALSGIVRAAAYAHATGRTLAGVDAGSLAGTFVPRGPVLP